MTPPATSAEPPEVAEPAPSARPLAVVWCRQVDHEEESPGYTTIPENFPGLQETLDTVRVVGNLAINVADTTDYWDPEPGTPLSYYPNLFLYPAYKGRYTCLGRMFLSKEDRPRLGMKTLVLPTEELLQPEGFGPTVLRWHASMGGARRSAPPASPAAPEPGLYDLVGEGFLFHRGSTDGVLLVASDRWHATMQVLLDLLRELPSAVTSLSAILAFPFFLPQGRVPMKELEEKIPLTLAVMRVPRSEAVGARHEKRVAEWRSTALTVRDLAPAQLPGLGPKGKEGALPLVLQYVRDADEPKLRPLRQRVDTVELPKRRAQLAEAGSFGAASRRKEGWRIGTAMESAALLLQRARGKSVPASAATSARAQEYLSVAPPTPKGPAPVEPDGTVEPAPAVAAPPWEPRGVGEGFRPAKPRDDLEVVPVPTTEDPSLHPIALNTPMLGLAVPKDGATVPDGGTELQRRIHEEVVRQLAEGGPAMTAGDRPATDRTPIPPALAERLDRLERSIEAAGAAGANGSAASELLRQNQIALASLREELLGRIDLAETKMRNSFAAALAPEIDRRVRQAVEPKLAEAVRIEAERHGTAAGQEVERAIAEMHERLRQEADETRSALTGQLDRHLREAADRELTVREAMEGRLKEAFDAHVTEAEGRFESRLAELTESARRQAEGFHEEGLGKVPALVEELLDSREADRSQREGAREAERQEAHSQALADLQVRFEQHIESRIGEAAEGERHRYIELFARMKIEVDQAIAQRFQTLSADSELVRQIDGRLGQRQKEALLSLERKIATAEERLTVEQSDGLQRLEGVEAALAERGEALARMEATVRTEIDDLDHRTRLLTERLIPVVRKAWLKIAELQQAPSGLPPGDGEAEHVRQMLVTETRRIDAEIDRRMAEIRQRVDSSIVHQGRIWLTLIHHLKELTDDRSIEELGIPNELGELRGEAELAATDPEPPPIASRRAPPPAPAPPPPVAAAAKATAPRRAPRRPAEPPPTD